jgi:phosphate-selective porin OprO/OprP
LTSSRFSSFIERSAFTDAFGFERRLGLSATYHSGALLLQGGLFTDNIDDLANDENNSLGVDLRAVYAPKLGKTQLHFGGSYHWRDLNDAATSVRYRQRPFTHTTDTRFIDTGSFSALSETGYGLELAAINGPFHFAGEAYWHKVGRPALAASPTFFGGSLEVGYFLTKGDSRGYKGGSFDRVKPVRAVGKGGMGALQFNLRYDYLDLVDAGIVGGVQNGYQASLVWTPVSYLRLMANYGRIEYDQAAIAAAAGSRSYGVDVAGMRAIFDF